jgi:phage terminase large subunit GpA-like protein
MKDESWFVDRRVFYGSPGRPDTWALLDDYLGTEFAHESGLKLRVLSVCVDSGGHFSQSVYQYTRARQSKRYFSCKGYGGFGRPFIGKPTRNNKARAILVPLGVDAGKELVYDRLKIADPGPGYMHFSEMCDEEYFRQLTAEKQVVKYNKGFPTRVWVLKEGRRNEMLDCEVLNLAAISLLNVNMVKMAERMQTEIAQLKPDEPEQEREVVVVEQPKKQARMGRRRKSFVNSW